MLKSTGKAKHMLGEHAGKGQTLNSKWKLLAAGTVLTPTGSDACGEWKAEHSSSFVRKVGANYKWQLWGAARAACPYCDIPRSQSHRPCSRLKENSSWQSRSMWQAFLVSAAQLSFMYVE